MRYIDLAHNYTISRILKGGWQLAGGHGEIDREQAIKDMAEFATLGITTFDMADIYTGVEEMTGEFLKDLEHNNPNLRSKMKIHTKYVPDRDKLPNLTFADTENIINRSLLRLGVQKLDLVQFHWWDYTAGDYVEAALHLKKLQEEGKIDLIGVTNFDVPHLQKIIDAGVEIDSIQLQYSLLDRRPEKFMLPYCQENNIKFLCYGTVAGGFLSEKWLNKPEPLEMENRSLTKYKLIIEDFGGWKLFQELLRTLDKVAKKYNTSIANISSRYILDKPNVAGVIVGARNSSHLQDTSNLFNFEFDQDDIEVINKVLSQAFELEGDCYTLERESIRHAGIMKYNLNKG
jgi:aryl-alcohol dehydrogenase-like predicted oxidoreductase